MTLLAAARDPSPPQSRAVPPAIQVERVSKFFPVRRPWLETLAHPLRHQRRTVLRDVTLEVPRGEFFGLLGPNGAGKSTLFKILSSLLIPDAGAARVAGYDCVRDAARVRGELASVTTDERSLYWRLSARENLRVYASLHRLRGTDARDRVDELLELVELTGAGDQMVGKFSSGMKQRLLIARTLVSRPRVLLLDEPTRSLDPISARRLRAFLREELAGRQGCTILLATHNAEEAFELCDRVGVLDEGRLLRVDRPQTLQEELRDDGYRLAVRATEWERFVSFSETRLGTRPALVEDGAWVVAQLRIAGGDQGAAATVAELVRHGFEVSRCEPVQLSLAELIERIVQGDRERDNFNA